MKEKILSWVNGWWDQTDPTKDVKLAAFAMVVIAGVAWLSISLWKNNWLITWEWNAAFWKLILATGLGSIANEAVKIFSKPDSGDKPDPPQP